MPEELNYALYLSYDDLPPQLKQCLLYCSFIPKNPKKLYFARDPLVQMWIGEGLVSSSFSDNLKEIGANYLEELIMRNLIEQDKGYMDQPYCRMHDVVRSFCQYIVRDEALVAQMGETDISSRLGSHQYHVLSVAVESGSSEFEWSVLQKQKSLRILMSYGPIKFKTSDSLSRFSRLRTLAIHDADFSPLVKYLSELKHLRYLSIACTEITSLPDNIGKMKFLQHISLCDCKKMVRLPSGIVKLKQLRYLNIVGANINSIPRGFSVLTNLRIIHDFPAHVDGDSNGWCTLEELGPLSHLRNLELIGLENVYPSSLATKAMLCTKKHLEKLTLTCSSRLGDDVPEEEQRRIEEVFGELCPPACINYLTIYGHFGRRLPNWMMPKRAEVPLERLKFLLLQNLAFCTQLPDGLCQLPCLEVLEVQRAPEIRRVGPELLRYSHPSRALQAFPRLNKLVMAGMGRWEEWDWGEETEAMPVLQELTLSICKLTRLPPGLAFHARALKMLTLHQAYLVVLENLPCLVELHLFCCHALKGITNLPSLHRLVISCCPQLEELHDVPELRRLFLDGGLPKYLLGLNLDYLALRCKLRCSVPWHWETLPPSGKSSAISIMWRPPTPMEGSESHTQGNLATLRPTSTLALRYSEMQRLSTDTLVEGGAEDWLIP